MHRAKKPSIVDLNEHLTCKICKGYFVNATTIIECLHSFCRSCIVKYLETSKYCPVCDVQVHKTKPLLNIRTDKILQDVVYKLVPRLFQNELQRRRDFYNGHPDGKPLLDPIVEANQHIISTDEILSLTMCYHGCKESVRYLRCPANISVRHLQKLIRAKYGCVEGDHHVDILYNQDCLNSALSLMDVAYIYSWKRKEPIELSYRIYEYMAKRRKLEVKDGGEEEEKANNNNWKEVQLRISENGEMSIVQDEVLELVNNNNYTMVDSKVSEELPVSEPSPTTTTSTSTTVTATTTCSVNAVSGDDEKKDEPVESDKGVKRKSESVSEPVKQKQTILNHSIGLHGLSNNHPLKKHSQTQASKSEETSQPKPNIINKTLTVPKPCYLPKPVINIPKPSTSVKSDKPQASCSSVAKPPSQPQLPKPTKPKSSAPIGYKTLRDPPKSWNSQIAKANINKPPPDPKYNDPKNLRPAKFFKMRNNLPRYLGNPASGVKPMYPAHLSPEKTESPPKGEIKKHSIVKIDPKTLKPISEKAPETSSLSNSSGDLKINTSSVSIFNPLKLQNSPKERKSPKSPHSPKTTSAPSKRDKLNLNFTPSNPFIPNLASPTMSPSQFLYPPTPPGFPPYDPRVMAAYHTLFYGQGMPFPPSALGMELNRKSFEMAAPGSPKVGGMAQAHSPQQPPLKLPLPDQLAMHHISRTLVNVNPPTGGNSSSSYKAPSSKRAGKESTSNKSEKSLQNAVEKLTQNRVKEIKNVAAADKKADAEEAKSKEERAAKASVEKGKDENGGRKVKDDNQNVKTAEVNESSSVNGETKEREEKGKTLGRSEQVEK